MKKFLKTLAIGAVCACCAFGVSACANVNGEDNGDSGLTVDNVENLVKDEETWNSAFENADYTNFSMRVKYGSEKESINNYCEITQNAVYYNLNNNVVFYSIKNDDGTYATYRKDGEAWILLDDTSDTFLKGAQNETVIRVSYADYFELFTFDDESASYVYDGEIKAKAYYASGEPIKFDMYCFNSVIKVKNNKISSIKCDYRFDIEGDTNTYSFEYFNIGETTVTVPDEVKNSAVTENKK